ncbi:hypothetical protein PG985_006657 [Apiospora marii]|uniref:Uncharacterized protein n=1 Tax=Apiospora marii TaxID=335849 RepID=A0ABR1S9N4_9PEZI
MILSASWNHAVTPSPTALVKPASWIDDIFHVGFFDIGTHSRTGNRGLSVRYNITYRLSLGIGLIAGFGLRNLSMSITIAIDEANGVARVDVVVFVNGVVAPQNGRRSPGVFSPSSFGWWQGTIFLFACAGTSVGTSISGNDLNGRFWSNHHHSPLSGDIEDAVDTVFSVATRPAVWSPTALELCAHHPHPSRRSPIRSFMTIAFMESRATELIEDTDLRV